LPTVWPQPVGTRAFSHAPLQILISETGVVFMPVCYVRNAFSDEKNAQT
jgi:hypothetical protein